MAINFHSDGNRSTYATREADPTWKYKIMDICSMKGLNILDIGCGGGIYARALIDMGAAHVTGIDFSEKQLSAAAANSKAYPQISFHLGNALHSDLKSEQYDIVLARAVIHHIRDLDAFFKETFRILKPGGQCLIQDRAPADCFLKGSPTHIREYFFSMFPELKSIETSRRYTSEKVHQVLGNTGFKDSVECKLWETRKIYIGTDDLMTDIRNRTGRSILHEINDKQLTELADFIGYQLDKISGPIFEKDRWTIWQAKKL